MFTVSGPAWHAVFRPGNREQNKTVKASASSPDPASPYLPQGNVVETAPDKKKLGIPTRQIRTVYRSNRAFCHPLPPAPGQKMLSVMLGGGELGEGETVVQRKPLGGKLEEKLVMC